MILLKKYIIYFLFLICFLLSREQENDIYNNNTSFRKILDYGLNYGASPTPPTLEAFTNVILTGVSGTFTANETVSISSSSLGGTVSSFTSTTGLLVLKTSDIPAQTLTIGDTITGATSGASGVIQRYDKATITATVDTTATTSGRYINEDGHASENAQKIQDSKLYQDYSYIV